VSVVNSLDADLIALTATSSTANRAS